MNLVPTIRLHLPSYVATFEFFINGRKLTVEETLVVFETANGLKSDALWAYKPSENGYIIYSPPQEFLLPAIEFQLYHKCDNYNRLFEWAPPYVVSEFLSNSKNIIVTIQAQDETPTTHTLYDLLTNSKAVPTRV